MVARSCPVGVKPHPVKPEDEVEELRKYLDLMRRNQIAAIKLTEKVIALVERRLAA